MSTSFNTIVVRNAIRDDMNFVEIMIKDLAIFENLIGDEPLPTAEDLIKACGFDSPATEPNIVILVAEDNGLLVGYTVLMSGYSARSGRILMMKNMFVRESHRAAGVGRDIFKGIAKYALEHGFRHEENHVLTWNVPAMKFYKRMGAVDMSASEGWLYYRVKDLQTTNIDSIE